MLSGVDRALLTEGTRYRDNTAHTYKRGNHYQISVSYCLFSVFSVQTVYLATRVKKKGQRICATSKQQLVLYLINNIQ